MEGFFRRTGSVVLLLLVLSIGATMAFAQGGGIVFGSISGTVQDSQGAVIPGATITAVNTATNNTLVTQSTSDGLFVVKQVPVGSYTITINATRFANLQIKDVVVVAGTASNVGVRQLKVGSTTETVEVEGGGAPLVETASSQIGATFESTTVAKLPTAGAFDQLALLVPGIANNGAANFSNTNGAAIANNGLRGRSNNFQLDGAANNDNSVAGSLAFFDNQDAIAEFQVVSNNFSAEYGRNTGTVVNYITKSGTNAIHGSGFEYYEGNWDRSYRNSEKNPLLGFCAAGQTTGCTAPNHHHIVDNRFGGTIGGPVLRNRLFFFGSVNEELTPAQTVGTSSSITPTPTGLSILGAAFPNSNAVKALNTFGPYALKVGNPTPTGTVQNVTVTSGGTTVAVPMSAVTRTVDASFNERDWSARGDWQISSKDKVFFRYFVQDSINHDAGGTTSSGAYDDVPAHDENWVVDYTRTWSPSFVQQGRFSYGKGFFQFVGGATMPQCTIANVSACPENIAFSDSAFSFTGFGLATNLPQDRVTQNWQYQSNLTWTKGRHTVKFGGELDRQHSPNHFLPSVNGGYTFASVGSTNAFSEFIQGASACPAGSTCSTLTLTSGQFNNDFAEYDASGYVQDDWRIRENLILNLGIRYEWDQQSINSLHQQTLANVASGFWSASAPSNVTILPHVKEDVNNWGPNLGFAWTPHIFGQDKTVLRGGYRVAYDPAFYNIFLNVATTAPAVNAGTIVNAGVPATSTGAAVTAAFLNQIPTGSNPGSRNQTRVSDNFHNPYVQQYSLGLEHQLNSRIAFEARYVGNHGVGNFQTVNANPQICSAFTGSTCSAGLMVQAPQYIPSGVTPCTPSQATATGNAGSTAQGRINCQFGLLRVRNNGAWSIYHGLQSEVRVRSFHGVTANVAYTWSKAVDNASEIFSSSGGVSTPISLNPFDPNVTERGVAAQSFPQNVSTYLVYELPWMKNQQGVLGHILGGWTFGGTHSWQSGAPFTPDQNTNNGDPYCDSGFNNSFIGSTLDSCRPLLSNAKAPFTSVGRYTSATQLVNVSTNTPVNPSDVHFIVNNTFAVNNLCGGDPFKCAVGRNVYRAQPRNTLNLSLQKTFKLTERVNFQIRGDAFNALNYQYLGVPSLNVNLRNRAVCNAASLSGCPTSQGFGETWGNTGTLRQIFVSAHLYF